MAAQTAVRAATWQDLGGLFSPEVLAAPKTCGDPSGDGAWRPVERRPIRYLAGSVASRPWADHLALAAAVLTARHLDAATVQSALVDVNVRLRHLFPACQIEEMAQWQPDVHLRAYLAGTVLGGDGLAKREQFWGHYCRLCDHVGSWLATLPGQQQATYRRFVLPLPVQRYDLAKLAGGMEVKRAQRQVRKAETDAVVPHYAELRAAAHLRFNRLARLRQAWHEALAGAGGRREAFPLTFSYEEGAPPAERLHFRGWDRRSFVMAHRESYGAKTLQAAARGEAAFSEQKQFALPGIRGRGGARPGGAARGPVVRGVAAP